MSEYQYYEFYSIDRELTSKEIEEINELSSRSSPTSRKAVFVYNFGDFKYNVESILLHYFDFFFYLSNWGTRRIMYKFPKELINYQALKKYNYPHEGDYMNEGIRISKKSDYIIVDITFSKDGGYDWSEDEGSWSSLLRSLRQEILEGDYRSLFIIWLHIKNLEYESEQIDLQKKIDKKWIPPNLSRLNKNLNALISFFEIDKDWVSGASKYSKAKVNTTINYEKYVQDLPQDSKEAYLLKILAGESNLSLKLKNEIDHLYIKQDKKEEKSSGKLSVSELISSIDKEREKMDSKRRERDR